MASRSSWSRFLPIILSAAIRDRRHRQDDEPYAADEVDPRLHPLAFAEVKLDASVCDPSGLQLQNHSRRGASGRASRRS
jgi:hypothetical protein